jgi:hypothetical protein
MGSAPSRRAAASIVSSPPQQASMPKSWNTRTVMGNSRMVRLTVMVGGISDWANI